MCSIHDRGCVTLTPSCVPPRYLYRGEEDRRKEQVHIVLKKWYNLHPENEFRVFVLAQRVVGRWNIGVYAVSPMIFSCALYTGGLPSGVSKSSLSHSFPLCCCWHRHLPKTHGLLVSSAVGSRPPGHSAGPDLVLRGHRHHTQYVWAHHLYVILLPSPPHAYSTWHKYQSAVVNRQATEQDSILLHVQGSVNSACNPVTSFLLLLWPSCPLNRPPQMSAMSTWTCAMAESR